MACLCEHGASSMKQGELTENGIWSPSLVPLRDPSVLCSATWGSVWAISGYIGRGSALLGSVGPFWVDSGTLRWHLRPIWGRFGRVLEFRRMFGERFPHKQVMSLREHASIAIGNCPDEVLATLSQCSEPKAPEPERLNWFGHVVSNRDYFLTVALRITDEAGEKMRKAYFCLQEPYLMCAIELRIRQAPRGPQPSPSDWLHGLLAGRRSKGLEVVPMKYSFTADFGNFRADSEVEVLPSIRLLGSKSVVFDMSWRQLPAALAMFPNGGDAELSVPTPAAQVQRTPIDLDMLREQPWLFDLWGEEQNRKERQSWHAVAATLPQKSPTTSATTTTTGARLPGSWTMSSTSCSGTVRTSMLAARRRRVPISAYRCFAGVDSETPRM